MLAAFIYLIQGYLQPVPSINEGHDEKYSMEYPPLSEQIRLCLANYEGSCLTGIKNSARF